MADPASVIGILGVCMQFAKEIVKYSTHFKNAPKDAKELVAEVAAIGVVLDDLRTYIQEQSVGRNSFSRTSVLFFAVDGCRQQLEDIHGKLGKLASHNRVVKLVERTLWPFDKKETKDAILALNRFAQIFHVALTLDGL